jgi:hypothetical protein
MALPEMGRNRMKQTWDGGTSPLHIFARQFVPFPAPQARVTRDMFLVIIDMSTTGGFVIS